jgi:hypothetical protein
MAHMRVQDSVGSINLLRGHHALPHRLQQNRSV